MRPLKNSEENYFTYTDIDMETTSLFSYSCFNYYLFFMECKFIYITEVNYFLIGLNERLYRFGMNTVLDIRFICKLSH
jgi:hypothetical protein